MVRAPRSASQNPNGRGMVPEEEFPGSTEARLVQELKGGRCLPGSNVRHAFFKVVGERRQQKVMQNLEECRRIREKAGGGHMVRWGSKAPTNLDPKGH